MRLWKDNRTDQEWTLEDAEIARRFWASQYGRNTLEGVRLDRALPLFIGAKESEGGLQSVWDSEHLAGLREYDRLREEVLTAWPKEVRQ